MDHHANTFQDLPGNTLFPTLNAKISLATPGPSNKKHCRPNKVGRQKGFEMPLGYFKIYIYIICSTSSLIQKLLTCTARDRFQHLGDPMVSGAALSGRAALSPRTGPCNCSAGAWDPPSRVPSAVSIRRPSGWSSDGLFLVTTD